MITYKDLYNEMVPLKKQYDLLDDTLEMRMNTLIPRFMTETGIDMWVICCREYNEDPIFPTIMPSLMFTARRLSLFVFVNGKDGFRAISVSRPDKRMERYYEGIWTDQTITQYERLAQLIEEVKPEKIGLNMTDICAMSDGLSKQLYDNIYQAVPDAYKDRICSAYQLSTRWLEYKTEVELSRYRSVYKLAVDIMEEAFSRQVIVPGVTTTDEVEEWVRQRVNDLGLITWFPPHVDVQRADESDTSNVIRHGDMLHYDMGIRYLGLCTDCQRLGYVLRDGETDVPEYLKEGMREANRFQDIVAENHITERTGNEILKASLEQAKNEGLQPMLYNHPIGYYGHGAGVTVGLFDKQDGVPGRGDFHLHKNTTYALELNTRREIAEWGGQTVRFMLEESVAFTKDGELEYLCEGRTKFLLV